MTDTPQANNAPELSGISIWRRVLLAVVNLAWFALVALFAPQLGRYLAGEGFAWWVGVPILLLPLLVVDVILRPVLLRPVRRNGAIDGE
jgi:hypothetical protein